MSTIIEVRTVTDANNESIRSVLKTLRRDPELRLRAAELVPVSGDLDDMGAADEILRLVLDPQLTAALAGALASWLATRSRRIELHFKKGDHELTVEADRSKDADALLREIQEFMTREIDQ
ncbi:effector-associated constant component EACC1 [Saccharopolyspora sp. NPDC002578]